MPLYPDPHLQGLVGFPYKWLTERLKEIGGPSIGASSSVREINDAFFDLMAAGRSVREDREASDQLRHVEQRLVLDFCMYQLRAEDDKLLESTLWDLELPLQLPDFLRLADGPPDFARDIIFPDIPDPGPPPLPAKVDPQTLVLRPLDIGPVVLDEEALWGDENG